MSDSEPSLVPNSDSPFDTIAMQWYRTDQIRYWWGMIVMV